MDKENLFETENQEAAEAIEEAAEEVTEVIEEAAEEIIDAVEAIDEEATEETIAFDDDAFVEAPKEKMSKGLLAVIIVAAVIVVAVGGLFAYSKLANKYNHLGFIDISGTTIGQVCEDAGMELSEFINLYALPADMPGSTTMNAAFSMLPLKTYAAMYYTDFATIKETFGIPDTIEKPAMTIWEKLKALFVKEEIEVTEDTPWGFALNEVPLDKVYGESFAEAKEYYGFSDNVTPETLYGDVRKHIEKKDRAERIKTEKEAEKAEEEADAPTEGEVPAEGEAEAPVEGAEAPAEGEAEAPVEGAEAPAEETAE